MVARQNNFTENMVFGEYVSDDINSPQYNRHVFPKRYLYCIYCKAKMWFEERLANGGIRVPKFGQCCLSGTVSIKDFNAYPAHLLNLIKSNNNDSRDFLQSIRLYNSILSFTSVSANLDERLLSRDRGVYTYRINGSIHHHISSFESENQKKAKFSQIYIYDPEMQSSIRTGMFPKAIKASVLNLFQEFLQQNNPYVQIYMHAGELLRQDKGKEVNIVLKTNLSKDKTKNTPTTNEVAALIVDNDQTKFNSRDVIVKQRNQEGEYPLKFINENLKFYDPLAYPLIHLNGEPGINNFPLCN
jgi:hypothetical protein